MTTRQFNDDGEYLWSFSNRFLVHCPQCNECALVIKTGKNFEYSARITCEHCGYCRDKSFDKVNWRSPVQTTARIRCGYCGTWLYKSKRLKEGPPKNKETELYCSRCEHHTRTELNETWS